MVTKDIKKDKTNGDIGDGFLVTCKKCKYDFYIYGHIPEPEIKISSSIDGRNFLAARNLKWPSFIKDEWDLRHFESVLTNYIKNGEDSVLDYYKKFYSKEVLKETKVIVKFLKKILS